MREIGHKKRHPREITDEREEEEKGEVGCQLTGTVVVQLADAAATGAAVVSDNGLVVLALFAHGDRLSKLLKGSLRGLRDLKTRRGQRHGTFTQKKEAER